MNEIPYHLSLSIVSRKKGQSATRKGAYNAGDRIRDLRTNKTHDYRYKKPGVVAVEMILPAGCSTELGRSDIWNLVEAKERRWDSRVSREFKGAVPSSLTKEGRLRVMVRFSQFLAEDLDTLVMGCMHRPGRGDKRNYHFHAQFPTRTFDGVALGKKHRRLDNPKTSRALLQEYRKMFAKIVNEELVKEGIDEFVDHRSYKERGIEKTPGVHLGPKRWSVKEKIAVEIADLEAALKAAVEDEAAIQPLTDSELEVASKTLHRVVAASEKGLPPPAGPFSINTEGMLIMEPSFHARMEETKKSEAEEEPKKGKNPTLQEFLYTWLLTLAWTEERRNKRKKGKKDDRSNA